MKKRKKPLRIGIDGRYAESEGGGINRYIQELIQEIIKRGDMPVVIATKKLALCHEGAEYVIVPKMGHWMIWEQIQLPLQMRKLNLDIYHATANSGVPYLSNIPTALTIHDVIPLQDTKYFHQSRSPQIAKSFYRLGLKLALFKSKSIIFTSQQILDDVKKYFNVDLKKSIVIPMGVDKKFFTDKKSSDQKILGKLSVSPPYILNFGGIDKRKNIDGLLKAYAVFLKSTKSTSKLVITGGEKKQVEAYMRIVKKLGIAEKVIFPGWLAYSDLPILVRNAQFVVYPTFAEGFGLPVAEAIAAGVPIVTSQLPTIYALHNDVPIFIDPGDKKNIAAGMKIAAGGLDKSRLMSGKNAVAKYSWQHTFKRTYEIYQML